MQLLILYNTSHRKPIQVVPNSEIEERTVEEAGIRDSAGWGTLTIKITFCCNVEVYATEEEPDHHMLQNEEMITLK